MDDAMVKERRVPVEFVAENTEWLGSKIYFDSDTTVTVLALHHDERVRDEVRVRERLAPRELALEPELGDADAPGSMRERERREDISDEERMCKRPRNSHGRSGFAGIVALFNATCGEREHVIPVERISLERRADEPVIEKCAEPSLRDTLRRKVKPGDLRRRQEARRRDRAEHFAITDVQNRASLPPLGTRPHGETHGKRTPTLQVGHRVRSAGSEHTGQSAM